MRHSVRSTRVPNRRPARYQNVSAITAASAPTSTSDNTLYSPTVRYAPAMMSVGYAGIGTPACSASTFANTSHNPCS